jgi:hypothetical protein
MKVGMDCVFSRAVVLAAMACWMSGMSLPGVAFGHQDTASGAEPETALRTQTDPTTAPVFKSYHGAWLGMTAEQVRDALGKPKEKGKDTDIFVLSNQESATVYYDENGTANAFVVQYRGAPDKLPDADSVLGVNLRPNDDGSAFKRIPYPEAGYAVSYSLIPGKAPMVIVMARTLQGRR